MLSTRIIVVLTIADGGLYRTVGFRSPSYVGDPLNAVQIFNDKEVDELLVLDISTERAMTDAKRRLYFQMASQAFMPMSYGGGLRSLKDMEQMFLLGYDKLVLNTAAVEDPGLITSAARLFGSQSISVSIDVTRGLLGKRVVATALGRSSTRLDPVQHARDCEERGAGELVVRSIAHDGKMAGYDLPLLKSISASVSIPVVAAGGAGSVSDLEAAIAAGAHSVSAGSMFVYHGKHRAVLLNYPKPEELGRNKYV